VQPTGSVRSFLRGRTFVLAGSTGFLAKVFLEKMLWEQPDVRKIFLIITPRGGRCAETRLRNEIIDSPLFSRLREKHGTGFESFIENRLVAVDGDIGIEGLGLSQEDESAIIDEAEVFVNSAAATTFNERFDTAVNINTLGPRRLLRLSRKCHNLVLICHISTAFVNGLRRGPVYERSFKMGDCIAQELDPTAYTAGFDPGAEVALALTAGRSSSVPSATWKIFSPFATHVEDHAIGENYKLLVKFIGRCQDFFRRASKPNERSLSRVESVLHDRMVRLGLARARMHGWQDTYVFTKAMGEQFLTAERGELPLIIIRPSIVEGALRDPSPGWIEGVRMADPLIIAYGKGLIRGFVGDPESVLDLVPVDAVVNVMLTAMARNACSGKSDGLLREEHTSFENSRRCPDREPNNLGPQRPQPGNDVKVYHVATSMLNPLKFSDFMQMISRHFVSSPLTDRRSGNIIVTDKNIKVFSSRLTFEFDTWYRQGGMSASCTWFLEKVRPGSVSPAMKRRNASTRRIFEQLRSMGNIYMPYTTYKARFCSENVKALRNSLCKDDRETFPFELETLDWEKYLHTVHIPGLLRYALKIM